eukprot:sb/3462169/
MRVTGSFRGLANRKREIQPIPTIHGANFNVTTLFRTTIDFVASFLSDAKAVVCITTLYSDPRRRSSKRKLPRLGQWTGYVWRHSHLVRSPPPMCVGITPGVYVTKGYVRLDLELQWSDPKEAYQDSRQRLAEPETPGTTQGSVGGLTEYTARRDPLNRLSHLPGTIEAFIIQATHTEKQKSLAQREVLQTVRCENATTGSCGTATVLLCKFPTCPSFFVTHTPLLLEAFSKISLSYATATAVILAGYANTIFSLQLLHLQMEVEVPEVVILHCSNKMSFRNDSISIRVEDMRSQPTWPALKHSLGVSISGCLMGITVAFSASALADMEDDYYLEKPKPSQAQWITATPALVALIWGLIYGRFIKFIGKRDTLLVASICYFIGYTIIAYSTLYLHVFIGRAITGFGLSMTSIALSVQLGILIINVLGVSPISFRWNASISSGVALINLFFIILSPETPMWLVSRSRPDEAERVLEGLMEDDPMLISEQLQMLHRSRRDVPQDEDSSLVPFFSRQNMKPLILMCFIMIFQQWTAVNAVLADSNRIFTEIGLPHPRICSAVMSAAFLLFTCGSAALTDKAEVPERLHVAILTIALGSYVFSFSMAWGSIPWVLCGEVFTTENQGRAVSMMRSRRQTDLIALSRTENQMGYGAAIQGSSARFTFTISITDYIWSAPFHRVCCQFQGLGCLVLFIPLLPDRVITVKVLLQGANEFMRSRRQTDLIALSRTENQMGYGAAIQGSSGRRHIYSYTYRGRGHWIWTGCQFGLVSLSLSRSLTIFGQRRFTGSVVSFKASFNKAGAIYICIDKLSSY